MSSRRRSIAITAVALAAIGVTPQDPGEGEPPRWRRDEIVSDIESRIAEQLLDSRDRIVTLAAVDRVIAARDQRFLVPAVESMATSSSDVGRP